MGNRSIFLTANVHLKVKVKWQRCWLDMWNKYKLIPNILATRNTTLYIHCLVILAISVQLLFVWAIMSDNRKILFICKDIIRIFTTRTMAPDITLPTSLLYFWVFYRNQNMFSWMMNECLKITQMSVQPFIVFISPCIYICKWFFAINILFHVLLLYIFQSNQQFMQWFYYLANSKKSQRAQIQDLVVEMYV